MSPEGMQQERRQERRRSGIVFTDRPARTHQELRFSVAPEEKRKHKKTNIISEISDNFGELLIIVVFYYSYSYYYYY